MTAIHLKAAMLAAACALAVTPAMAADNASGKSGASGKSTSAAAGQSASKGSCPDIFAKVGAKVSKQEANKARMTAFDQLDQDKDGVIRHDEYVACLAKSPAFTATGVQAKSRQQADADFGRMDKNKDKSLSKDEWNSGA